MGETNMLKNRTLLINITDNVGEVSEKRHVNVGEVETDFGANSSKQHHFSQTARRATQYHRQNDREISKKMKESGIIERIGADRGGFWKINK